MPRFRAIGSLVLMSLFVAGVPAYAQIAQTFDRVATLLKPGDGVIVVDTAGVETWGRLIDVTAAALTVSPIRRTGNETVSGTERRTFAAADVQLLTRADDTGVRMGVVYPASWERVEALPRGEDVTVTLEAGGRRRSRFELTTADALQVTVDGRAESFMKRAVAKVERHGYKDGTADGAIKGALVGVATGIAIVASAYASCNDTCDAPAPGPLYLGFATFTGTIGGFTGWLIDRLHRGREVLFPAVPSKLKSTKSR